MTVSVLKQEGDREAMGSAKTAFKFSKGVWADVKADVLMIPVFQDENSHSAPKDTRKKSGNKSEGLSLSGDLKMLDQAMQGMIQLAADDEKFSGAKKSLLSLRKTPADQIHVRRVLLVGLGSKDKLSVETLEQAYQKAFGAIIDLKDLKSVALALPEDTSIEPNALLQALTDAAYQTTYRSEEATKKGPELKEVLLLTATSTTAAMKKALSEALALAEARSFVKDLVNKPANLKKTDTLANAAKTIGKLPGMTIQVETRLDWLEKNMPCFFEVARGSLDSDPPKFITLTYKPAASGKKSKSPHKKIALVGKSVIFDTGGYQVKTGNYMNTMKGDMTGGACVLGTMRALAELKPNVEVTAYLAATPNKIDSGAMIPDSIVNTACGKKVEIRHTDAEGRLTLIDAVALAAKEKPDEMITIATLTGSASQAVGLRIALMGNNNELRNRVEQAARYLGEPVQPLDVLEEDFEDIKSKLDGADIRNTHKSKGRGAQTAAAFVMSGAPEDLPIAHLDIAGADMTPDEKATGIGVKTLIRYVLNAQ